MWNENNSQLNSLKINVARYCVKGHRSGLLWFFCNMQSKRIMDNTDNPVLFHVEPEALTEGFQHPGAYCVPLPANELLFTFSRKIVENALIRR